MSIISSQSSKSGHLNQSSHLSKSSQLGIGLVEVMVALLLLAVAVLGFSAMQMQAVKATDESLTRSSAVGAMRSLAEDIRLNPSRKLQYYDAISGVWTAATDKTVDGYTTSVAAFKIANPKNCVSGSSCTRDEQVNYNAHISMKAVSDGNMMMNAIACPGTDVRGRAFTATATLLPKLCLMISWDDTLPEAKPTSGTSGEEFCIDEAGAYNRGSSCLVMETY